MLNETEQEAANKFIREHRVNDPASLGCIGGQFTYMITPTSLGNTVVIRDNVSGLEENVTDFGMW